VFNTGIRPFVAVGGDELFFAGFAQKVLGPIHLATIFDYFWTVTMGQPTLIAISHTTQS